jgi:hypothetical protein
MIIHSFVTAGCGKATPATATAAADGIDEADSEPLNPSSRDQPPAHADAVDDEEAQAEKSKDK